jgi:dihydropteroate synthase
MGVLNVTPDSFSDGGLYAKPAEAVERAWQIAEDGADILDVGGESTRPGSQGVSADEELRRLLPVLEGLTSQYPIPISVDTSKAEVARAALERGASLINDVTGLQKDPRIGEEVARFDAALILMHMRGEPGTMQLLSPSPDILAEIEAWVEEAVARAKNSGVSSTKIILDPGIGFGKTVTQSLQVILEAARLGNLGFPLLFGTSRKSFIGEILNRATGERIWGTAATVAASIIYGAHMVRVHDVAAMRDVARVIDALVSERSME